MDTALIGVLVGGIIGALASLIGVVANGYYNRSNLILQIERQEIRELRYFRLAKLEEIHLNVSQFIVEVSKYTTGIILLAQKRYLPQEYTEVADKLMESLTKMSSQVNIHTPELSGKMDALIESVTILSATTRLYLIEKKAGMDLFQEKAYKAISDSQILAQEISKLSKEIVMSGNDPKKLTR